MKKILIILGLMLFFGVSVQAKDVVPTKVFGAEQNSYGLYQISQNSMTLYSEPNLNSKITKKIAWNTESTDTEGIELQDLFILYLPERGLALLDVVDETDDWVKVVYNRKKGSAGWLEKGDQFKFMPWGVFMSMYGKKYGLYPLKGAPETGKVMRTAPENFAQIAGEMNHPKVINLNAVKGNWVLVSVSDIDKFPKTGFVRWRADNGEKYYFPKIKVLTGVNDF